MPLTTLYPPIPQTVWKANDPAIQITESMDGTTTSGPHIDLNMGLYGVEAQFAPGDPSIPADLQVGLVQITADSGSRILTEAPITAGQIVGAFGGMYGGVRLNLILDEPTKDVEFRVINYSPVAVQPRGFKLVPRPGRVWFPGDLPNTPEHWTMNPDRSASAITATALRGPYVTLYPGEYRVGVKFTPPSGMKSGAIAEIDVSSDGEHNIHPPITVTAEQTLANFGIPDAKLRFRLDRVHKGVEIRVRALVEGATVQWVRLATDDEATWHHYFNMGGTSSALGQPTSGFLPRGASLYGLTGSVRHFQHGAIYWTVEHGPCEVYTISGARFGDLGYPISRPRREGEHIRQIFEGGEITYPSPAI